MIKLGHLPSSYIKFLAKLKDRVRSAQIKAAVSVNRELILLYYQIGQGILGQQRSRGWGAKIVDRLSRDLRLEFPDMKGFSPRNLKYMRALAEAYPKGRFVQQLAAQIPWFHHCVILDKVSDEAQRQWYVRQTIQHGWSRNVLVHQIESGLYRRQGKALTNFDRTLPPPQSDLAREELKDPYVFDFLTLGGKAQERELGQSLLLHLRNFLLELGIGFSFVGSQYRLVVGGDEFYLDLLLYHLRLRCYVVIELKVGPFKPEYAGKMNFYLSAVDDLLRQPEDNPSIGIILCKTKNRIVAEYALKDTHKPIGIAAYHLTEKLPEVLKGKLPSIEELEAGLSTKEVNDLCSLKGKVKIDVDLKSLRKVRNGVAFLFCTASFALAMTAGWCVEPEASPPPPRAFYWTSTGQNLQPEKPPEIPFLERQALFDLLKVQKSVLFLDVREPAEFEKKHLPNALNIPFSTRQENFEKLKKQTDKILVPYCNWDFRAYVAALDMKQAGIQNIRMMYPHGLRGWMAAGLPTAGQGAGQSDLQAWDILLKAIENPVLLEPPSPSKGERTGKGDRISVSLELLPTKANPSHINASVGDTIVIELISAQEDHWFVIPDFGVNLHLNLRERRTVEIPITRAGYFPYGCITCCERYRCQTKQAILVDLQGDPTQYGE